MPFVLDNSVVTGWYLSEQASAYTDAVAALLKTDRALVPPLWQQELANVLRTACNRGKLAPTAARQIIDTLGDLPIDVDTRPCRDNPPHVISQNLVRLSCRGRAPEDGAAVGG